MQAAGFGQGKSLKPITTCRPASNLLTLWTEAHMSHYVSAQVSSKRVIDGVPMHLRHYLLRRFCNELKDLPIAMTNGSAASGRLPSSSALLNGEDEVGAQVKGVDAAQLMAEDPATAECRAQLQRQIEQLQSVRKILSVF